MVRSFPFVLFEGIKHTKTKSRKVGSSRARAGRRLSFSFNRIEDSQQPRASCLVLYAASYNLAGGSLAAKERLTSRRFFLFPGFFFSVGGLAHNGWGGSPAPPPRSVSSPAFVPLAYMQTARRSTNIVELRALVVCSRARSS
jgi:hypothetical protein